MDVAMKIIFCVLVFLFSLNGWCQYEELNNAQILSGYNSKMVERIKLDQELLNNTEVIKINRTASIIKSISYFERLHKQSNIVADSIKTQVLSYNSMLNGTTKKNKVLQLLNKIQKEFSKFNKTKRRLVKELNKKGTEFQIMVVLKLYAKLERYLRDIKKATNRLENIYMYSLKDSRAY